MTIHYVKLSICNLVILKLSIAHIHSNFCIPRNTNMHIPYGLSLWSTKHLYLYVLSYQSCKIYYVKEFMKNYVSLPKLKFCEQQSEPMFYNLEFIIITVYR